MALSTGGAKNRRVAGHLGLSPVIANAVSVIKGGFAGLRGPDHATSQGQVAPYNDEKGMIFTGGFFTRADGIQEVVGDTSASVPPEANYEVGPKILLQQGVTGASAATDVGRVVYATDDDTLTLTRPTNGTPVGMILGWHTSTICDVLLWGLIGQAAIDLGGQGQELMYLGHFNANTVANGDLRTGIPMPFHGEILEVFAMIDVAIAGSSATASINLEIGGTNVDGGVVTIAESDAKGTKKSGTAITDNAVFHEGDPLDIEASSVTDATAGSFDLYAIVAKKLGV